MKAIRYAKYGPPEVMELMEVEIPAPKDNEVLVEIHAASVNALDWHLLTADIFLVRLMGAGLLKPKNPKLGADIAGTIKAAGRKVKQFHPGDEVFGDVSASGYGGFAEYVCAPEDALARKPDNVSFEEAAAAPVAAFTALQGLRDQGNIQPGQKVLIQGASGGVGTFAVQIAKALGAEVTAVCSPGNLDQALAIGADRVIDYTKEDFTRKGKAYDLIFAANGYHPLPAYKRALAPQGRYVMAGGTASQIFEAMLLGPLLSDKGGRKLGGVSAKSDPRDLDFIRGLLEAKKIVPVIDRRYPLSRTADALCYLGQGHAKGKVVITVSR